MITTFEIAPSPALAPFIRCYSHIEFNTRGLDFIRPTNAIHEIAMTFQLKDKPKRIIEHCQIQSFENTYGGVMGLFTEENGDMLFNGHYIFFEIMFKPNGFYKIFQLPPRYLNNQMMHGEDIFEQSIKSLSNRLVSIQNFEEMCSIMNTFLLNYLNKQRAVDYKDSMTYVSNLINKNKGNINIDQLAYSANMSIRNFERHFIHQVGISPKLFCNITRFNHALAMKLQNPRSDWTSIALDCGYYDQMHLIKDFRKFAGYTPSIVEKQTHLAKVNFKSRVEH